MQPWSAQWGSGASPQNYSDKEARSMLLSPSIQGGNQPTSLSTGANPANYQPPACRAVSFYPIGHERRLGRAASGLPACKGGSHTAGGGRPATAGGRRQSRGVGPGGRSAPGGAASESAAEHRSQAVRPPRVLWFAGAQLQRRARRQSDPGGGHPGTWPSGGLAHAAQQRARLGHAAG